jgi:hypothetical protein
MYELRLMQFGDAVRVSVEALLQALKVVLVEWRSE